MTFEGDLNQKINTGQKEWLNHHYGLTNEQVSDAAKRTGLSEDEIRKIQDSRTKSARGLLQHGAQIDENPDSGALHMTGKQRDAKANEYFKEKLSQENDEILQGAKGTGIDLSDVYPDVLPDTSFGKEHLEALKAREQKKAENNEKETEPSGKEELAEKFKEYGKTARVANENGNGIGKTTLPARKLASSEEPSSEKEERPGTDEDKPSEESQGNIDEVKDKDIETLDQGDVAEQKSRLKSVFENRSNKPEEGESRIDMVRRLVDKRAESTGKHGLGAMKPVVMQAHKELRKEYFDSKSKGKNPKRDTGEKEVREEAKKKIELDHDEVIKLLDEALRLMPHNEAKNLEELMKAMIKRNGSVTKEQKQAVADEIRLRQKYMTEASRKISQDAIDWLEQGIEKAAEKSDLKNEENVNAEESVEPSREGVLSKAKEMLNKWRREGKKDTVVQGIKQGLVNQGFATKNESGKVIPTKKPGAKESVEAYYILERDYNSFVRKFVPPEIEKLKKRLQAGETELDIDREFFRDGLMVIEEENGKVVFNSQSPENSFAKILAFKEVTGKKAGISVETKEGENLEGKIEKAMNGVDRIEEKILELRKFIKNA